MIFNESFPDDFEYVNHHVQKNDIGTLVGQCVARFDRGKVEVILDNLKRLGFHYSTRAGVTIGLDDVVTPQEKAKILDGYEKQADKIEAQYRRGIITDDERRQELIEIWTRATDEVKDAMEASFTERNPIYMMAYSGARGNIMQIRQIAGMRGLVANPKGEIIPRPIKANFREGMTVLEYFISTHGARKGLADTALRTADSGYLTRRLVDVAQEVIIREEDCESDRGLPVQVSVTTPDGRTEAINKQVLDSKLFGRVLAEDVKDGRTVVMKRNTQVDDDELRVLMESGVETVYVRSVLTCDAVVGVCRLCYGRNLATGRLVDIGEAVGIIAAQSIGEPGTQLTMRTFHTGGVAGEDITHGLPRVQELFEARRPKGEAQITELSGTVEIEDDDEKKVRRITVTSDDGDQVQYAVSLRARLAVSDGDAVEVGQQLTEGSVNPHEKLRVEGVQALQLHLVDQVQEVYRSQGVTIHDKHIELINRQMLRKVHIIEPGDTEFLPGELVDRKRFEEKNAEIVESGGEPASARPILMGITKASLATDSWLAAASFQETTRVLTEAAISGKSDPLLGLKENVIIGKLIPAGSGLARYRNAQVRIKEEAMPEWWLARQRELAEAREEMETSGGVPPALGIDDPRRGRAGAGRRPEPRRSLITLDRPIARATLRPARMGRPEPFLPEVGQLADGRELGQRGRRRVDVEGQRPAPIRGEDVGVGHERHVVPLLDPVRRRLQPLRLARPGRPRSRTRSPRSCRTRRWRAAFRCRRRTRGRARTSRRRSCARSSCSTASGCTRRRRPCRTACSAASCAGRRCCP